MAEAEEIVRDCRVDLARMKRNQELFCREMEQARREIETSVNLLRRVGAELSRFDDAVNQPRPCPTAPLTAKTGFESPRERHPWSQHLKLLQFFALKVPPSKSGTLNVHRLSFAIAASASFFLRAARV